MSHEELNCLDAFRHSMRRLAGGVALLTTADGPRRYGMTMTAVMSLTMNPPALIVAINRTASIAAPLISRGAFCVNLLRASHKTMCDTFSALPSDERFSVGDWLESNAGIPYLRDAQAAIFCNVGPIQDFGTHSLVIGTVTAALLEDEIDPLIHLEGRYVAATALQGHRVA